MVDILFMEMPEHDNSLLTFIYLNTKLVNKFELIRIISLKEWLPHFRLQSSKLLNSLGKQINIL